ncbi:uncharacterized protein BKA55DRAFT_532094 [Fusarium redolens]|uniref:Uncharacterized protein n=1 Tax=Fusarium redolens TaxID=48865 RepID=A0A9P9R8P6_FUSRE|nr:uncharacterized protein BKA55DRAFT_532094 [Fusarium redolens]KAH7269438.1 hypothetical protein BKA55DRAFT_532094 [Fusarium redolens]
MNANENRYFSCEPRMRCYKSWSATVDGGLPRRLACATAAGPFTLDPAKAIQGCAKTDYADAATNSPGRSNSYELSARFSRGITSGTLVLYWFNCWTTTDEAKDKNRESCRAVQIGPRTQEVTFHAQFSPRHPKFPCVKESNSAKVPCLTVATLAAELPSLPWESMD